MAEVLTARTSSVLSLPAPAVPVWGDNSVQLKDFSAKRQVPGFAKIVKGSYMTLGASKFSLSKQHHEVFVHSVKVGVKVLAHCVRRVEAQTLPRRGASHVTARLYSLDQRLAVPITYQGWFELLSEDGKSARPITSVHELSKVKPDKVLVRENIKGYVIEDGTKPSFDKTKIVIAGEQLLLNGEMSLPSNMENRKVKLLRCIDSMGDFVYLSFDQKGLFTTIAGEKDVTGIFNIRDIVQRFRLPLTVKLVQGVRPKVDPSRFTGLIRLDWVYTDETAFVCPIEKNHVRLLPVPTDAPLQMVAATNQQAMTSSDLYAAMMAKCGRMIHNYNNTLHLIVQIPEAAAKSKSRQSNIFSLAAQSEASPSTRSKQREKRLMDEIDDLYGYVRDGGAVPPRVKFSYDSDEESYWEEPAYEPLDEFRARLKALEAGEPVTYPEKYKPREPARVISEAKKTEPVYGTVWGNARIRQSGSSGSLSSIPPALPQKPTDLLPRDALVTSGSTVVNITSDEKTAEVKTSKTELKSIAPESPSPSVHTPPPLPPRNFSEVDTSPAPHTVNGVTTVSNFGLVSSSNTSLVDLSDSPHHLTRSFSQPQHKLSPAKPAVLLTSKSSSEIRQKRAAFAQTRAKSSVESSNSGNQSNSSSNSGRALARDFKDSDISSVGGLGGHKKPVSARRRMQTLYL